jgi:hypothetical protein
VHSYRGGWSEENAEKTRHISMARYQEAGQRSSIKIANMSLEDVAKFKYLETTLAYTKRLRAD